MEFFERIKLGFYTYKTNIIIGGVLVFLVLISNFLIYYVLSNKVNSITPVNEIIYLDSKEEESLVLEEEKDVYYKVDIKGAVTNQGVYELKKNSRVVDVIKLAGGLKKDADTSVNNLSKYINDEMVIVIYTKEEVERFKEVKQEEIQKEEQCIIYNEVIENDSCKEEQSNETEDQEIKDNQEIDVKISINSADLELLMTLPGIGESKAQSIIEYRNKTPFEKTEDIMNVSGIGEKAFEQIKDYITI